MTENHVTPRATSILVWDMAIRIFHWSLVATFAVAYVSAEISIKVHEIAGYVVLALLTLRVLWGFIGTEHARFRNFVRPPNIALRYLLALARGRAKRYMGHNPAGGAMIVTLIVTIAVTSITGHYMLTVDYFGEEWLEDLHKTSANLSVILIALHVVGVGVSSWLHRENLVRAMITGFKRSKLE